MDTTPNACAHAIVEVAPAIVQAIRMETRAEGRHDLTVPQFRTLVFLGREPGSSLSAAADYIGLTLPTMSVLVEALVQRNLISRVPDLRDRRRVLLSLTEEGRTLLERVLQATEGSIAGLFTGLSLEEREAVMRGLSILRPLFMPVANARSVKQE